MLASDIRLEELGGKAVPYEEAKARYISDSTLLSLRRQNMARRVVYTDGVFEFILSEIDISTDTESTKRAKRNTLKHLKDYHKSISPKVPIYWEQFNADYIAGFMKYLEALGTQGSSTINKHIKHIKLFHRLGVEAGKVTKLREEDTQKTYLKPKDLEALNVLELEEGSTIEIVRDWFLIACGTGLRVSDLLRLTPTNIHPSDIEGEGKEIRIRTQKTKHEVIIPLIVPCVVGTLEGLGWVFPKRLEPQTLNRFLKELCRRAGLTEITEIEKNGRKLEKWEAVTMHTARHTFATQALMKGIRPELVAQITGHKNLGVLDKYYNRQTQRDKLEAFVRDYIKSNNLK